jgi:hypothetical protein
VRRHDKLEGADAARAQPPSNRDDAHRLVGVGHDPRPVGARRIPAHHHLDASGIVARSGTILQRAQTRNIFGTRDPDLERDHTNGDQSAPNERHE